MVESVKELRKICKGSEEVLKTAGLYERILRSNIATYFTKFFLMINFTANRVTILLTIVGLIACFFLALHNISLMLIGAILLHFAFLLDMVDGEVARYRKTISLLGNHLDQIEHFVVRPLMYLTIGFSVFKISGLESALFFGFICSIFSSSVVMTAMNHTLINCRFRELREKREFPLKKKKEKKLLVKIEGEIPGRFNRLYLISKRIKFLWRTPGDILIILLVLIIEFINSKFLLLFKESMLIYLFLLFYSLLFVLMQIISLIIHTKSNTIETYYNTLFKR